MYNNEQFKKKLRKIPIFDGMRNNKTVMNTVN